MEFRRILPPALALLIGTICGVLGYQSGMPLPWMLGPMIGTTIAAMTGVPIQGPNALRPFVVPVIGVMLGSAITAEIASQLPRWFGTLAIMPIFLAAAAGVSFVVYRRIGGYDQITAYYAAMPGGLTEMVIFGGAAGGNERRIALAHAARILLVIFFVVFYFGFVLGVETGPGNNSWIALADLTTGDYVILALCAMLGIPLARVLRLPAAPVFGPMILSGAAHLAGIVTVAPPTLFVNAAQIAMGTIIGARFIGATVREVRRDLSLASVASIAMLAIAVAFAQAVALFTGLPASQVFLAYSPGGLTEMSLLAIAMGQDAAFVSVMHILRITMIIGISPVVFGRLSRKRS